MFRATSVAMTGPSSMTRLWYAVSTLYAIRTRSCPTMSSHRGRMLMLMGGAVRPMSPLSRTALSASCADERQQQAADRVGGDEGEQRTRLREAVDDEAAWSGGHRTEAAGQPDRQPGRPDAARDGLHLEEDREADHRVRQSPERRREEQRLDARDPQVLPVLTHSRDPTSRGGSSRPPGTGPAPAWPDAIAQAASMDRRQWPSNHWGSPSSIGMTVSRHQSSCAGSSAGRGSRPRCRTSRS